MTSSDGTIEVGTGGISTRFIKENWPITEGIEGGTTKTSGKTTNLVPEGDVKGKKSNVPNRKRKLI